MYRYNSFQKKLAWTFGIIFICSITFFSIEAKAGFLDAILNPIETINKAIVGFLVSIATGFASWAFGLLGDLVVAQTDISKIPNISTFISWAKYSAGSLIIFFFIKRIVEGLRDNATGEGEPNYAEMIGSTAVSMALVWVIPEVVYTLIRVNNQIVQAITSIGIKVDGDYGVAIIEDMVGPNPTLAVIHIVLIAIIWVICVVIFAIMGAVRYVELGILLIMGPIAATGYANRSQIVGTYMTEAVAIIFTQVAHVILAYWIIQWSAIGDFWGLLSAIGAVFVSIKGPQVLRQYIYNSGTGSAVGNISRMAIYRKMMPGR